MLRQKVLSWQTTIFADLLNVKMPTALKLFIAKISMKSGQILKKVNFRQNVVIAQIKYFSTLFLAKLTLERLSRVIKVTLFLSKS